MCIPTGVVTVQIKIYYVLVIDCVSIYTDINGLGNILLPRSEEIAYDRCIYFDATINISSSFVR